MRNPLVLFNSRATTVYCVFVFGLDERELKVLRKLDTPAKVQDFIDALKVNFEPRGDTCMSPRMVLRKRRCHCIEGALLAALALRLQGRKPLVVDMKAGVNDFEHVIAVFRQNGKWGAISKTNHAVLRYREPVYASIRELVMSYFHEYFDNKGRKTLRSFSVPVDLSIFDKKGWTTDGKDLWYIHDYLDKVRHFKILDRGQIARLRRASRLEIQAGKLIEWKR